MRNTNSLRPLLRQNRCPDHVGLAYDVWAPIDLHGDEAGKVPHAQQDAWFGRLENTPIDADYKPVFERWREGLQKDDAHWMEITLKSRLLVGHGNPAPTEVGLSVHHTWGVPVIPGSALKGLLNHYVQIVYGPDADGRHPYDPEHPEPERRDYQGVTWNHENKRILHGPGAVHRALFGAPDAETDERTIRALRSTNPELAELVGACQGLVQFHDALYMPGTADGRPYAKDVLTVHHRKYYGQTSTANGHQSWPNDYDSPNPVSFLTVKPKTKFFVALTGPGAWTELAIERLKDALEEWGIGGKTSAGYGRMRFGQIQQGGSQTEAAPIDNAVADVRRDTRILREAAGVTRQNAEDRVPRWLAEISPGKKTELARLLVERLTRSWLRRERSRWSNDLLTAAGEP